MKFFVLLHMCFLVALNSTTRECECKVLVLYPDGHPATCRPATLSTASRSRSRSDRHGFLSHFGTYGAKVHGVTIRGKNHQMTLVEWEIPHSTVPDLRSRPRNNMFFVSSTHSDKRKYITGT
jgi:hypothetical protein